jgi:hypothetical protein
VPGFGIILSAEHTIADATTPSRPHIAAKDIVPMAIIETIKFSVNTVRVRRRIEHFDRASAT